MPTNPQIKVAASALLIGLVIVNPPGPRDWFTPGLLAFGLFNVLVSPVGTGMIRATAMAFTVVALLFHEAGFLVMFLSWLFWPPAFMVSWALGADPDDEPRSEESGAGARARVATAALIAAVACGSLAYRALVIHNLQQTAALFVGIPALLAIVVVVGVMPRTATGVAIKAVTVGLLVSLLFLGEGILCVVMSAPIFYAIALTIAAALDATRKAGKSTAMCWCLVVLVVAPMSLEGVTPLTTVDREESISETRIVHASPSDVQRALFESPRFDRALPLYLRAGFPNAIATRIEREAGRMRWVIRVRGGEMRLNGMEPRAGDLVLELEDARPGLVRWHAVSDSSHMTHFLSWRDIVVEWRPVAGNRSATVVTWTLKYERGLDPAWYFGPWERYAVRLAAGYLIDSVATP